MRSWLRLVYGRVCRGVLLGALVALLGLQVASAQCTAGACVYAGPRLASIDSERSVLLNATLGALLGSNVALDVLDWNALAAGEVNLVSFIDALALDLSLSDTQQVLLADVSLLQALTAAVDVAQADGDTLLVNALNALIVPVSGLTGSIKLGDLLELSFPDGSLSDISLNVLDFVTGMVQLYNYENVLTTPSPVTLDGSLLGTLGLAGTFNSLELYLQVVEPPVYTCGPQGSTFHTAAVRSKLNMDLVEVNPDTTALVNALTTALGLLGTSITVDVSIGQLEVYAEIARAEGTLSAVDALANTVTVNAIPGVVDVYVGQMADALFFNRTHIIDPPTDVQAGNIGTLAIEIEQTLPPVAAITLADVSVGIQARATGQGEAPFATNLLFTGPYPETQTASSSANFVNNLITEVITDLTLQLDGSLGTLLDPLVNSVILPQVKSLTESTLSPILTTVLVGVVDPVLEALGIRIGEVDVTVLGIGTLCEDGSIRVILDVEPDDPTDFTFLANGTGVSDSVLDDDSDPTLSNSVLFENLTTGSYTFSFDQLAGWMVTAISCTELNSGTDSTINYGTGAFFIGDTDISIDLENNEQLTCTYTVQADTDGDYIPDSTDPNPARIDPQGYFYDEASGNIIPGGSISVTDSSGSSANVLLVADGATGAYRFYVTVADTYTLAVVPPPGYVLSSNCPARASAYDVTSIPNPNVIGSEADATTSYLLDGSCGANPYYETFIWNAGDAVMINNNIAVVSDVSISKGFAPAVTQTNTSSTLSISIDNTGTNAINLTNLSLTDTFPANLVIASTPNSSTSCSGGSVTANAGDSQVTLSGVSLAANATCVVEVDVVSAAAGAYENVILAGALVNDEFVFANANASATLTVGGTDFGDTPASYADAWHSVPASPDVYLGATAPDAETSTLQGSDSGVSALGDDTDGVDDEDGVTLNGSVLDGQTLIAGSTQTLDIVTAGSGVLNAWIDWNADTDFDDPGEQIATDVTPSSNSITLTVTVPQSVTTGVTYARFRFSSDAGLTPSGSATDGEVEDYQITLSSLTITGSVYHDKQPNYLLDSSDSTTGLSLYVKLVPNADCSDMSASVATQATAVSLVDGSYGFSDVPAGSYCVVLDDNAVLTDVTAFDAGAAGWVYTETPAGVKAITLSTLDANSMNFGLFNGSVITGTVFQDDGFVSTTGPAYSSVTDANNAVQSVNELAGANVSLVVTDGASSRTALTGGDGAYTLFIPASWSSGVTLQAENKTITGYNSDGVTPLYTVSDLQDASTARISFNHTPGTSNVYNIGVVNASKLRPDQSGQGTSPSSVRYTHLYTPGTLGISTLSITGGNYSYQIKQDTNCNGVIDTNEQTAISSLTVDATWPRDTNGQLASCALEVHINIPAGIPDGRLDIINLTAELEWQTNTAVSDPQSVTDVTTIVSGGALEVQKQVRNITTGTPFSTLSEGLPGDVLEYCIAFVNRGSDVVSAAEILDSLPFFTVYVVGSASAGASYSDSAGVSFTYTPVADGDNQDAQVEVIRWLLGDLAAGESGQVCYQARIQ